MTNLSREQRKGIISTVAASFFLGWAPILGKLAYQGGVAPFTLAAFRTAAAAALIWLAFLILWRREIAISWRGLVGCISVGMVNGFGSLLYYTSLQRLDASLASLLNTLYPLWVVLFLFAAGQPLTRLTLVRLALSMLGVYLLTRTRTGKLDWLGMTLMIASAATYGWHLVLGQWVLADVPSRTGALYILTTMSGVVGVARLLQGQPVEPITPQGWTAILALGLTTALSRLATFSALRLVGGVETALVGLLELLVSLVLAFLLLGERLSPVQWLGGLVMIVSLLLMSKDPGMRLAAGDVPVEWNLDGND
ncbi:MAG TPA: DMT family transporter [Anaerolineae bacterium]|nr:DMT family transporter [Anaerolineae bacterium]